MKRAKRKCTKNSFSLFAAEKGWRSQSTWLNLAVQWHAAIVVELRLHALITHTLNLSFQTHLHPHVWTERLTLMLLLFIGSVVSNSSVTPCTAAHQASLSFTTSRSVLKFMPTESVMPSNHLILCHPLLLLPSIFPSIRGFSNESALHIRWSKYCSFSINPSNEYSGLISFRMVWFDLLAVQGTLKRLHQHHS